jgi:hypothetical protein
MGVKTVFTEKNKQKWETLEWFLWLDTEDINDVILNTNNKGKRVKYEQSSDQKHVKMKSGKKFIFWIISLIGENNLYYYYQDTELTKNRNESKWKRVHNLQRAFLYSRKTFSWNKDENIECILNWFLS